MFTLENDHPIPEHLRSSRGRPATYPFESMKVGQSFWVPQGAAPRVMDAVKHYRARHKGWDYASQRSPAGVRIWRTA